MKYQSNNLAYTNKWVADLPLSTIITDVEDTSLNLVAYSIPATQISSSQISYQGNNIEIPTGIINPDDKEITFNYLLSSDWSQYKNLHRWVSLIANINKSIDVEARTQMESSSSYFNYTLPIRVYILDEYKNRVISIKYENCWISNFSEISMDYSDDPSTINHSFTVKYSNFFIEDIEN